MASLDKLKGRRVGACQRLIINVRQHPPLMSIDPPPPPSHVQSETSRTNRLLSTYCVIAHLSVYP